MCKIGALKCGFCPELKYLLLHFGWKGVCRAPSCIFVDDKSSAFFFCSLLQPRDLALGKPQQFCRLLPRDGLAPVSVYHLELSQLFLSQCYRPFHAFILHLKGDIFSS